MVTVAARQVLAAKIEAVCGTAEVLGAADAAFIVTNPDIEPVIDFAQRDRNDTFDAQDAVPTAHRGRCTFSAEVTGDGAGGVPLWATVFLPACTMVKGAATQVFTRTVAPPTGGADATAVRTLTIGLYKDGIYEQIHGAMGKVNFVFVVGQFVQADFEFEGVYPSNADDPVLSPTYPTVLPSRFADSSYFKLGVTSTPIAGLNIDLGNEIVLVEDRTQASGYKHAVVTGGEVGGRVNPESATTTTKARRDALLNRTKVVVTVQVGPVTNRVQWQGTKLQWLGLGTEDDGILRDSLPFRLNSTIGQSNGAVYMQFS